MSVTVTLTFPDAAAAAAFLAGNAVPTAAPAPTTKAAAQKAETAAASSRTAEAAPAAAPAAKALDFKADVIPALKDYAGKVPRETFAALLKKYGVEKVPGLEAKPDTWAEIIETCKAG